MAETPSPTTEFQVTYWRELPSMVAARSGAQSSKRMLAGRLQAGIDEAAMRLGEDSSDDYLAGWRRTDWTAAKGDPDAVLERVSTDLEAQWPARAITTYLNGLT